MRRVVPLICLIGWLAFPLAVLAHGSSAPAPRFPDVLWAWSFDLIPVALIAVSGGSYLWAVRRVNAAHPANPHRRVRTWCWFGGLAAIGVALLSPIEAYEGVLFSVHMTQHMLLQLVAAPLLLAGGPITLALRASSPPSSGRPRAGSRMSRRRSSSSFATSPGNRSIRKLRPTSATGPSMPTRRPSARSFRSSATVRAAAPSRATRPPRG